MASDIIVLDASVALEWVLPGAVNREYADAVLMSILDGEVVAHAPELMTLECAYVLGKAVGQGRVTTAQTRQFGEALDRVISHIHTGRSPFVSGALAVAERYELAAYDACYFDLAVFLGCPIAAIDKAVRRACTQFDVPLYLAHIA